MTLRLPALVAAPFVYLGLEMARSHLLTGFAMTGLGHSQYRWTALAQIADLAGIGGVRRGDRVGRCGLGPNAPRRRVAKLPGGRCCPPARRWDCVWSMATGGWLSSRPALARKWL